MTIQEAIRQMARGGMEVYCKVCEVTGVNEQARTINCTPIDDGAELLDVNLQANQESTEGFVLFPAVGSYVVVGFLSEAVAVVLLCDKIDKAVIRTGDMSLQVSEEGIILNEGTLGGLVRIQQLTDKLNELINAFNSHTHEIEPGSVAVTGSSTAQSNAAPVIVPAITGKHQHVSVSDYENDKVKH